MSVNRLKNLASCGELLIDFGLQPVSNRFLAVDSPASVPLFPLQLRVDPDTGLVHQGQPFPVDAIRPHYDWLTCFEPEDHLDALAETLTRLPGVTASSIFGAYSFKDDTTLRRLERLGYAKNWRIDPARDLGVMDERANVETYQLALTVDKARAIRARRGPADVMIVRHVVEHAYDLPAFIEAIRALVSPGGYIVWELPDCERALSAGDCTTVWEEHVYYFTAHTFRALLQECGFSIVYYESVNYALENSLVAIVQEAQPNATPVTPDLPQVATEVARARRYAHSVLQRRIAVRNQLLAMRAEYGPLAMFGAGHLSVAFLSLMGVADLFACVIDDNPNKKGLLMPVGGLPITGSDVLYAGEIKVCLLGLNPQNQPKVVAKHPRFVDQGGIFASIFPGSERDLERMQ
jgi:hypothetical protein